MINVRFFGIPATSEARIRRVDKLVSAKVSDEKIRVSPLGESINIIMQFRRHKSW